MIPLQAVASNLTLTEKHGNRAVAQAASASLVVWSIP